MLRSELRPRRSWIDDVRVRAVMVTVLAAASIGMAVLTYHVWGDDRRAERLRELDKQVGSTSAVVPSPRDVDVDKELPPGAKDFTYTIDEPSMDTATFSNPALYKNIVVWDRALNQELVTVHPQARTPSFSKRRDIGVKVTQDDIVKLVKTKVEEAGKTYDAPTNNWWCAHQCSPGADCYAMWIEDHTNHVLLTLPCVNGKSGTWTMAKLQ